MALRTSTLVILSGLLITLVACRKESDEARWDLEVAVPLVSTALTLGDIIPDSLIMEDGEGNLSLLYQDRLFSLRLDTVLTAPDTSLRYSYVLPIPGPLQFPAGTAFNSSENITRFDLEELEMSVLRVRSGMLQVEITNMINGTILGNFSLPGATLDGAPLAVQQTVPPGTPAMPSTVSTGRALDGYRFDLRGPEGDDVNTLAMALSYLTDPAGGTVSISSTDSLIAHVSYLDIIPEYAKGFFGTRDITIEPSSTSLDLFEGISGVLDLESVSARLRITNGIGIDARATIGHLRSVNTATGSSVEMNAPITNGPINLDRAIDLGSGFQEAVNTWTLNSGNSNVEAFVENLPDRIEYALDLRIAPLGNVSNGNDFLYYESRINADLELEIPLRLSATDLTLARTLTVDLPGTLQGHAVRSGTLHVFATNGLPFSAGLGLAIVDEGDQVLLPLQAGGTVAAASVDGSGTVSSSSESHLRFLLDEAAMDLLHTTGRVRVTAVFNTPNGNEHVQLRSDYRMDLRLSFEGNYLVNGDE
ncbi:MAG TPA: hypothetical protein VGE21_08295 [Flavobacteriales bacterium]